MDTPAAYARQLATYIASPTKIEALTRVEFGKAPPLHEIARMRLRVERDARRVPSRWVKDSEEHDGEDFRPRSLVAPEKPALVERKRDYINISSPHEGSVPKPVVEIIDAVADAFSVSSDAMRGKGKGRVLVLARAVAMQLIRDRLWPDGAHKHSTTTIGRYFGGRDHSTVCHALDHFEDYKRQSPETAEIYERLRERTDG